MDGLNSLTENHIRLHVISDAEVPQSLEDRICSYHQDEKKQVDTGYTQEQKPLAGLAVKQLSCPRDDREHRRHVWIAGWLLLTAGAYGCTRHVLG